MGTFPADIASVDYGIDGEISKHLGQGILSIIDTTYFACHGRVWYDI